MKIQLKSRLNASILFECEADTFKIAVELAVSKNADLRGANLRRVDLRGANLYGEKLTQNPVQLLGLKWWILMTTGHIKIGCEVHKAEEWWKFTDKEISAMHKEALPWWKAHKKILMALHKEYCKEK